MNFVGKVLIVLQVVLSLGFLGFAGAVYSVQTSWRERASSLEEDLEALRTTQRETEAELQQVRSDMEERVEQAEARADNFEARAGALDRELTMVEEQLEQARTERDAQQALAEIATEEARMRREEAQTQRAANRKLHENLNELMSQVRSLEDERYNMEQNREELLAKHRTILDQMALMKKALAANGLETDPEEYRARQTPPPTVMGEVVATRQRGRTAPELVEVSIGSDDGLAKGHELFIYRPEGKGQYLGKIRVVNVGPDRAVGSVMVRSKNGVIEKGDHVTTKL